MTDIKWAFVGDLQIPYQDDRAVALFLKAMKWWKPDAIDVVGDIDDQLEYSSFSDGTTDEFFALLKNDLKANEKNLLDHSKAMDKYLAAMEKDPDTDHPLPILSDPVSVNPLPFVKKNADGAREFYQTLRKNHPKADIHASLGNHEMRVWNYLGKKWPEAVGLISPNFLWGLDDAGITWRMYHEKPFLRFSDIHVHHGVGSTITGLQVKTDIENMGISLVRGHDHRGGVVYKSQPLAERSLVGMGTGHLCDPHEYGLRYADNPTWQKGFGLAHVVDDKAHLQFIPIRDYTCVVDGRVFRG